ncbi:hypothetical protein VTK56DRAFT_5052 [Thermocarpiscus australiensis]
MIRTTQIPSKQKFLPLREITVNSRPLVKRAIRFSCDGELAVTADDSVHVFVPEFPDLSKRRENRRGQPNGQQKGVSGDGIWPGHDASSSEGEDDDENETGPRTYNRQVLRPQYSEGSQHMPVSYPPLDPRLNRELFVAAGIPFPYDAAGDADGRSDDSNDDSADSDASASEGEEAGGASLGLNQPYGAGYGPITGVGSSMNHVVCVGWSPSGLGVNRRPILGVLTGSGTLAMYGDGGEFANILPRANEGMLQRRELSSWIVLWGVGERLMVPGQQAEISEYIQGFAWAREIGPGQALLATINDVQEVAIISVQSVFVAEEGTSKGDLPLPMEPRGNVVWLVREMVRFKAEGPHEKQSPLDVDWVPCGTSFGLNWSPWLEAGESRTCVLSFVDRNYVGFRRITIKEAWARGDLPVLEVERYDVCGRCLHLSSDAFVEFEDAIWTQGPVKTCRGIIVTGFHPKPFEVALSGGSGSQQEKHSVWDCGTVYGDAADQPSENPIVDLVIHPPDLSSPAPTPLYTLIRMSATATTRDWYETNAPAPIDPAAGPRPQWVGTIAQKLEVSVPVDMHLKRSYNDDDSNSDVSASGSDDEEGGLDLDAEDLGFLPEDDTMLTTGDDHGTALKTPEIHPYRFRLHGLTISPGGGVTAVLASSHSTQLPEKGGWHTMRSSVLFGQRPRRQRRQRQQDDHTNKQPIDPRIMTTHAEPDTSSRLTTEAKLFEHLYGGGPEVPGVHYHRAGPASASSSAASASASDDEQLRRLFAAAVASQTCELCGSRLSLRKGGSGNSLSGCERGHFFGTCATSGLAVQTPGGTRSCGACGLRTMRPEVLVAKMPAERREEVRRVVGDGVCGACGGKFLS